MTQTAPDKRYLRYIRTGRIFKSIRVEKGLDQAEVAVAMHIPRSGLAHVESGKRSIKLEELFDFCEFIGVKPEDVVKRIMS